MSSKEDEKKGSKMYGNLAYNTYASNNATIESPTKLVEMMYEGVLRFNAQAKKAMLEKNNEKKVYWINRSIAIISELIGTLNFDGGRIAHYLHGLYNYELQLLNKACHTNDEASLNEVNNVFRELLEAWRDSINVDR